MPFKVGNSSTEGYYSKNMAYYLVINDYSDVTLYADLMTKKGLQTRLEGIYIVNPIASGSLNGSYITEWDTKRRRYSLNAVHSSQFFFGTELNASADIMSDASYVPDYGEERLDWLKQDLFSYAELSRRLGQVGRFSTRAERYVDFIHHSRYYELPVARLNFGARPIVAGWNFTPGVAIANRVESYADSTNHDTASTTRRRGSANVNISSPQYSIGTLGSLSAMQSLGLGTVRTYYNDSLRSKPLNANHSIQVSADQRFYGTLANTEAITFNQTDDLSDSLPVNVRYAGSISSSITFFRVYGIEGMGMHGLLHSVRPSAGLSYEPKVDTGGFFGRPHFGKPDQASLQLGMVHAFQAKVDTLRTKRDLGTINFSTRYDFVDTVQHLKPLYGVLTFLPLQGTNARMQVEASASYQFDSAKLGKDYQVTTSFYGTSIKADTFEIERGVQLGVNHTWSRDIHMITGSASVAAFGWKVSLNSIGYNFKDITGKKLTDYSITVLRNLHCWEAIANFQKLGPKWKYDFEIRIKKLPDIKFGKSTFRTFIPGED
jgi:lipopolysaccharide assembly outer membrane protein LptD (OstA)